MSMTDDAQLEPTPTSDRGQLVLLGLIAIALIASVIMLVTGSVGVLKLAMVVALWAAVLSIFLASKYRSELVRERAEFAEELALERQTSEQVRAQREAEEQAAQASAESEAVAKAAAEAARAAATDTATAAALAEISEQLAQVRAQLENLTGAIFAEPNMVLQAEAIRIQALEKTVAQQREELTVGQTQHTQPPANAVTAEVDTTADEESTQQQGASQGAGAAAEAASAPAAAAQVAHSKVAAASQPAPTAAAQATKVAAPAQATAAQVNAQTNAQADANAEAVAPAAPAAPTPVFDAQAAPTRKWTVPATDTGNAAASTQTPQATDPSQAAAPQATTPQAVTTPQPAPASPAPDAKQQSTDHTATAAKRHGRRRREETGGLSVAELLKKQGR